MNKNTRDRLVLPILLPMGLLAAMILTMFGFSRILLNTTADAATAVAFIVAIAIIVAAALIASRGKGKGATGLASMLGLVAGVALLAGGVALAVAKPGEEGDGGAKVFAAQIAAPAGAATKGFSTSSLSLPAEEKVALAFDNQDPGVPHNVVVTQDDVQKDPSTPVLFQPSGTITGPAKTVYNLSPLKEGTYYFHCEVHPTTMNGKVTVSAGAGSSGGGPTVSIAAQNLQFDTKELDFPADTPSTLSFDNKDAGTPHNVAIYEDDSLAKVLFNFDPFPGVAQKSFPLPPLPTGTYFFHCDVHPSMHGTVVVKGAPGGTQGGGQGGGGSGPPSGPPPSSTAAPSSPPASTSGGGTSTATVSVVAQGVQFDTSEISLKANAQTTLSFDNQDAGTPHNVSIYSVSPSTDPNADQLFSFEPIPGPVKKDFTIPGLPAGTYYFQCDVHTTMNGQVKVT